MMRRTLLAAGILLAALIAAGRNPWVAAAAPQQSATIVRNEAISDFGKEVRFELEATSEAPIVDVAFLYTFGVMPGDVPAFVEASPDWQPGSREVKASFARDTTVEFLPVDVTVRYKWVLTDADGAITETPEQTVQYLDTRFGWQEKTARGITVRWYAGDDAWGQALLDTALAALDRLEQRVGGTVDGPMTITIYETTRDMRAALPPNSAEWIGGQARPDLGLIIGAIEPGDESELGRLVPHELSHLVLFQATDNNYGGMPVWFDEGSAVANQDTPDPGFKERVSDAARAGELIPLRALASNFPSDPEKALLSYAQSESVVRYIEKQYGVAAVAALVAQFKAGSTDDSAVESALKISLDDLDANWRATLPAPERTPPLVTGSERAPADRFRDTPREVAGNGGGLVAVSGSALPAWVWVAGGLGVLMILVGGVWIVRESRR